ncbi:MAG: hypothetical protein KCHDKBKB_02172 [Elusimicrobia bacterium]|nr:hypothetical protein [Elusimicrobiota bacterium]
MNNLSTPMTRLPNENDELLEEALSEIFEARENGQCSATQITQLLNQKIKPGILEELKLRHSVEEKSGEIHLSSTGEKLAHEVIRRKRLAERLLKDVLNVKDEFIDPAACQWEHILSKEVTDSICTLLGHPVQSPRHLKIPEGECCKAAVKAVEPVICSLDLLSLGAKAKISYLLVKQNPELGRLLSLGLVPGTLIQVIQRFPTFVVQAGETQLAFDDSIAQSIFVHPI